jgi:hypothetical protein
MIYDNSNKNSSYTYFTDLINDCTFSYSDSNGIELVKSQTSSTEKHSSSEALRQDFIHQSNSTTTTLVIDQDTLLADKYSDILLSNIKEYGYENGFESPADHLLLEYFKKYGDKQTINILATLWRKSYYINGVNYLTAVLNLISNITFHIKIDEILFVFASSALNHAELEVKESALALFESWDDPNYLGYIKGMKDTGVDWFDEYRTDVINSLEAKKINAKVN